MPSWEYRMKPWTSKITTGETSAAVHSVTVFCEVVWVVVHGKELGSQLLYEFFFVAANGEKKWASLPADQWGESCWNSAWELSRMEQKVYPPGVAAWATSKQAKVRHKHSLSKVWPGFLCTNLNLIWGWQQSVPAGRFHSGSIRKVQIAFGAFCCRGSKSCVCNFNKVICLKCLVEKKKSQKDCFIYTKKYVWSFNFFRHFCCQIF